MSACPSCGNAHLTEVEMNQVIDLAVSSLTGDEGATLSLAEGELGARALDTALCEFSLLFNSDG